MLEFQVPALPLPEPRPSGELRQGGRQGGQGIGQGVDLGWRRKNCAAARVASATPLHRGEPGYRSALDRDGNGNACKVD